MFWCFGCEARGILAPDQGLNLHPLYSLQARAAQGRMFKANVAWAPSWILTTGKTHVNWEKEGSVHVNGDFPAFCTFVSQLQHHRNRVWFWDRV